MSDFIKLMARGENPGREVTMVASADQALDALWKLAVELPKTGLVWEACPVASIDVHTETAETR